jgi:PII-like signaling protein
MTQADALKLTLYFGERDRAEGRFLADALLDLFERHAFQTSILLRGIEGFGLKHHLHTERFLTLSDDLPLVSVAVDTRERIKAALPEVQSLTFDGLVTLERARLVTGEVGSIALPHELHEATKLTIYCGRKERIEGTPAYIAITDLLHRRGVAGATVLLGVDGTVRGERQRAHFFGRNAEVPLMIISVGDGTTIAGLLPDLAAMLCNPLLTLERVRLCKRDGNRLGDPRVLPEVDESSLPVWQKLMIYAGEQARHGGHPLYIELIHQLRRAGASGATSVRGIWGYHGDHAPHGDKLWSLPRRVPVVTVIVDTPERVRRWFEIVDALTDETGLVTSEMVPASRATAPGVGPRPLRLARFLP